MSTEVREPATARGRPSSRLAEPLRFLVWGRAVPIGLFGYLSWLILQRFLGSFSALGAHPGWVEIAAGPVRFGVYLLFCALPVALMVVRPMPAARDGRVLIRLAAFGGTTMLLVAGAVVPGGPLLVTMPAGTGAVATVLLVVMEIVALYGLITLNRSFSIIPEARRAVTSGPYRLIRHPLYAAEIGAAVAIALPSPRLSVVALLVPFIAVQMIRATAEEKLLCRALPDYVPYRARTRRFIPGIW